MPILEHQMLPFQNISRINILSFLIVLGRRSRGEDNYLYYYLLTKVKEKDPSRRTNYIILLS
jgi:hypothetical protein